MDLAKVKDAVLMIENGTDEQVAAGLDLCRAAEEQIRELRKLCTASMIQRITERGPLTINNIRYYVGANKKTKVRDLADAVEAVVMQAGGDVREVAKYLSSDALKHGACRGLLGDEWDKHFEVTEEMELREGAEKPTPKRELQSINLNFVK